MHRKENAIMTKGKRNAPLPRKKIDTPIIVALITVVGTIVAAIFASPVLIEVIRQTPTPTTRAVTSTVPVATHVSKDQVCASLLKGGFEYVWLTYQAVRDQLGCPLQREEGGLAEEQLFERGVMYWRNADQQIYVLNITSGMWNKYPSTIVPGESLPELTPPPEKFAPEGRFRKLWNSSPELQSEIGWAEGGLGTMTDSARLAAWQPFNGGFMLFSWNINGPSCRAYVLFDDHVFMDLPAGAYDCK